MPAVVEGAYACSSFKEDKSLFKALASDFCIRPPDSPVFQRLEKYLRDLDCGVILTENRYVDRDFMSDFGHFYAACFKPYPKYTKRLHFFRGERNAIQTNFELILDTRETDLSVEAMKFLQNKYLGFVVAKPLPETVIGRTVLALPPNAKNAEIQAIRKHEINLFGTKLSIESLDFQEQDRALAACATSALWTAFHKTSFEFQHYLPTPFEITRNATRHMLTQRAIPSSGLTAHQMAASINELGLEAEVKKYRAEEDKGEPLLPILAFCYSYLRFGVPVILGVRIEDNGWHAITLLGYELGPKDKLPNEVALLAHKWSFLRLKSSRIARFYAHDDQRGPFTQYDINFEDEFNSVFLTGGWLNKSGDPARITPTVVVVPLYHKIRISPIPVLNHLFGFARYLESLKIFQSASTELEYDVSLANINKYKAALVSDERIVNRKVALLRPTPRYFWRVVAESEGTPVFDLLADATDPERSFQLFAMNFFDKDFLRLMDGLLKDAAFASRARTRLSSQMFDLFERSVRESAS